MANERLVNYNLYRSRASMYAISKYNQNATCSSKFMFKKNIVLNKYKYSYFLSNYAHEIRICIDVYKYFLKSMFF